MANDPFTLVIALDKNDSARGELYFDDSISYGYKKNNEFVHREFNYQNSKLTSKKANADSKFTTKAWIERIIIYGVKTEPKTVTIEDANKQSAQLQFTYDPNGQTLLIRKPAVNINIDFSVVIQ